MVLDGAEADASSPSACRDLVFSCGSRDVREYTAKKLAPDTFYTVRCAALYFPSLLFILQLPSFRYIQLYTIKCSDYCSWAV